MNEFAPTAAQQKAIDTRNSSALISAAAGSGKTRVITERVLSYILNEEDPASIREFLIITFTKAAAAELKSRIGKALGSAMKERSEDRWLKEQQILCRQASIGTIHSFCQDVLKENSHVLGLAPDFRVIDEDRAALMKRAAIEKTMEIRYDSMDRHPEFEALVNLVGTGRDDSRLVGLALELYEKMQSHPSPAAWAEEQKRQFLLEGIEDPAQTVWGQELIRQAKRFAWEWIGRWEELLEEMAREDPVLYEKIGNSLEDTREGLRRFARALEESWEAAGKAAEIPFPRMTVPPKIATDYSEKIKRLRKICQNKAKRIAEPFQRPKETVLQELENMAPSMCALMDLVMDFTKEYQKRKRRASVVDFSDLEHLALSLMEDDSGTPTNIAQALSERYREIMVDEYQDVSEVQEHLFHAISRAQNNLFMVGDVKQSIYRFRLADPKIFLRKYEEYVEFDIAEETEPKKIFLQENFRSRKEILHAVNHVFRTCMSPSVGELYYDENAALHFGAEYYEGEVPMPEILVLDSEDTEEEAPDKVRREAAVAAKKILQLMTDGTTVFDGKDSRPLKFGDVAILLRSANTVGKQYREVLEEYGIPAIAAGGNAFFQTMEISTMISLLNVIDNPYQDIPLIAVLNSPLLGVSPDELTEIGAAERELGLFDAVKNTAEGHPACRKLTELLERYRLLASDVNLSSLVWMLYDELNVIAVYSAMTGGEARRENLLTLLEYTKRFEETGYTGVRRFIQWLRRQEERGQNPAIRAETSAVQILSIHKAKGLEFPVVLLCDTGRMFNKSDSRETVLIHPQLGLGPKMVDLRERYSYPTIARLAIRNRLEQETVSEEMRLLYVALTRARERLIITGSLKKAEETIEEMRIVAEKPMIPEVVEKAAAPLTWLLYSALADTDHVLDWQIVRDAEGQDNSETTDSTETVLEADPVWKRKLEHNLSYTYPYGEDTRLPSKTTATELKKRLTGPRLEPDMESYQLAKLHRGEFLKFEDFIKRKQSGSARAGTATHLVLQHLDFGSADTKEAVAKQINQMQIDGILSEEEAKLVHVPSVVRLMESETGKGLRAHSGSLNREFTFSVLIPADELKLGASSEKILLQGAIDCWYEDVDGLVIVDYKTDHVEGEALEERVEEYRTQIEAYAVALEEIVQKPVIKTILYFLRAGQEKVIPRH